MAPNLKVTHLALLLFSLFLAVDAINFNWNCELAYGTCQNFCYYTHCRSGAKSIFTYDSDKKARDKRRVASGCRKSPCTKNNLPWAKFGNSCDEFPFASTKEGGKDAQLRCVEDKDNDSEGGQLSAFYRKIKNGDKFGITIENYGGISYCNDNTDCKNDGGQFQMNSAGNFVSSRDMTGRSEFSLNKDTEPVVSKLKKVEAEDGSLHLVIAEDPEDPIGPGHEIWNAFSDKPLAIVRVVEEEE